MEDCSQILKKTERIENVVRIDNFDKATDPVQLKGRYQNWFFHEGWGKEVSEISSDKTEFAQPSATCNVKRIAKKKKKLKGNEQGESLITWKGVL